MKGEGLSRFRIPPALKGTFALLRLITAVHQSRVVLVALGVLVAAAAPLAFMVVSGALVGSVPAAISGGISSSAGHRCLLLLGVTSALVLVPRVLVPILASAATVFGREVNVELQERTMTAVSRPPGIGHLEDPEILNLIETAQGTGTHGFRPGEAVPALTSLLPDWLQSLGSAIILATFRWWLGVAWLLLWPVVLYFLQAEYIKVGETANAQTTAIRRAGYFRNIALTPGPSKEVRIWGLANWLDRRFESAWLAVMSPIWRSRDPRRPVIWVTAAVVGLAAAGTFGSIIHAGVAGALGLGSLAMLVQAGLGVTRFRSSDDANMVLAYAALSVPTLLELERRTALALGTSPETPGPLSLAPAQEIVFDDVDFRYPGQTAAVLSGLDLELEAGQSLAIVGENGAGKTTLVKLLCALYQPSAGRVVVDGIDLRSVNPQAWRRQVAAIFQDFAHYQLSLRDNVALGAVHLGGDPAALKRAAERAGALELVDSLPLGWDSVLSRQYEAGVELSGGQWQRVALARALYAVEGGARLLILDEPTANLDIRAEAEIYDRFLELTAGLTTILISHRFATVRRASRIVVLEGGRIVEDGTHESLVSLGGRYARMFALQAERFTAGSVPIEASA